MNRIDWWRTDIADKEIDSVVNAIRGKRITMGKETQELEKSIAVSLGVSFAVMFSSGSASLYAALMTKGIGNSDEVIVPNRTFVATANAVKMTGANVRLVDSCSANTNIDLDAIADAITAKTKAIMPVHLNGRAVDMKRIKELANKFNLVVIEDACQALFSKSGCGAFLGTLSDIGCFSLGLSKLLTTGYGGFAVCHDEETQHKLIRLRDHDRLDKDEYCNFGFNFKFPDILAAIGNVQINKVSDKINHVTNIYKMYRDGLRNLDFLDFSEVNVDVGEIPLWSEVFSAERDGIVKYLDENLVNTFKVHPSLHHSKYLHDDEANNNFKNSLRYENQGFILPCGPNQPLENVERVTKLLNKYR